MNVTVRTTLELNKLSTISNSGKKEGMGGIEALETNKTPNKILNQDRPNSALKIYSIREAVACLNVPAIKNIPLAAHPWANDKSTVLNNATLLPILSPTIMKVMCVTLL